MNPITPQPPGAFEMFVNQTSAWLFLAAALVITNFLTGFLMRRVGERRARRARDKRARLAGRHVKPEHAWRGEIPPTWFIPVQIPVVTEAFPAGQLAEGW